MATLPKEACEITDTEKRDVTQLIQQGKALPEKYGFVCAHPSRGGQSPPQTFELLGTRFSEYQEVAQ